MSKILIFSWASTDFLYEDKLRDSGYLVEKRIVSHHRDWFGLNRSLTKELWHLLVNVVGKVLRAVGGKGVILFGTNLCRLMFPFLFFMKRTVYVYNELPCLNKKSCIYWYDKFIFFVGGKRVYVSSRERRELCRKYFGSPSPGVLNNMPRLGGNFSSAKEEAIVYAGLVNRNRFGPHELRHIKSSGLKLNIVGVITDACEILEEDFVSYRGVMSYDECKAFQGQFRYALLSYPKTDLNNDYCAPIKIYEYVDSGCVCVSVHDNVGLERYFLEYPEVFVLLSDLRLFVYDKKRFEEGRRRFLDAEYCVLNNAVNTIANSVGG